MTENKLKQIAETFWKSYLKGWAEILQMNEQDFIPTYDKEERNLQARLIRDLVCEFEYYNTGDGEDMVIDSQKLLDFADTLENL